MESYANEENKYLIVDQYQNLENSNQWYKYERAKILEVKPDDFLQLTVN